MAKSWLTEENLAEKRREWGAWAPATQGRSWFVPSTAEGIVKRDRSEFASGFGTW